MFHTIYINTRSIPFMQSYLLGECKTLWGSVSEVAMRAALLLQISVADLSLIGIAQAWSHCWIYLLDEGHRNRQ